MDPAAIFRAAGVDPEALRVPGKRIPLRVAQRLWRVVDEVVGDPGFGIAVAKQMHGTALHALGYAWLSSATLGEALRRFARYSRVLTVHEWFRCPIVLGEILTPEEPARARCAPCIDAPCCRTHRLARVLRNHFT